MANPSKTRGTAAESAVVAFLRARGWLHAERRALAGHLDRGDVAGVPGVVLEVKNCRTHDLAGWARELAVEQANDRADIGAIVAKRRGTTNPADWYALMPFGQLCDLLTAAGYGGDLTSPHDPRRPQDEPMSAPDEPSPEQESPMSHDEKETAR